MDVHDHLENFVTLAAIADVFLLLDSNRYLR